MQSLGFISAMLPMHCCFFKVAMFQRSSAINWKSVRNHGQTDTHISVEHVVYSSECCLNYILVCAGLTLLVPQNNPLGSVFIP